MAGGVEIAGENNGVETVMRGVVEQMGRVAAVVITGEFVVAFFHGPETGKSDFGLHRGLDLANFIVAHYAQGDLGAVMPRGFDVDANGAVT